MSLSASQAARLREASVIAYPGGGLRVWLQRRRYRRRALENWPLFSSLIDPPPGSSALGRFVAARPNAVSFVEAPFIHADWAGEKAVTTFVRQFELVQGMGEVFAFDPTHSIELLRLDEFGPDYHLVLDKPDWFLREGMFTLNIFRGNVRLISLSFSFDVEGADRIVVIGAVQGRKIEGALDEYRQLTKLAHGMRPRDLLIDVLRVLAKSQGAVRMIAVSDSCRHHRSPYFSKDTGRDLPLDYDEIWRDRGGVDRGDGFFDLPVERQVRPLEDIAGKKRQMYRQRYEMMDEIEQRILRALPEIKPVIRPEAD